MFTAAEIASLRELAESRMGAANGSSTGILHRKTGEMTTGARGLQVPEWVIVHDELAGRVKDPGGGASQYQTLNIGGVEVTVPIRVLHLPVSTPDVRTGDHYEITEGENAGMVYRIIEAASADQRTALRLPVVAVARPEEW